ncbi:MAG: prolipoprotein diacylglyceryl transferase [Bacteroidota bacterium]
MYPRISDFINDIFGTDINLPIQSYGFFLALTFLVAALIIKHELARKEKEGVIKSTFKKTLIGKPASITELATTFVLSLIAGYKISGIFVYYNLMIADPQGFVFSSQGSLLGGVIIATGFTYYQYHIKNKQKLEVPEWKNIEIPAKDQVWPLVFIAAIFGIIGAKIFHQLENMDEFMRDPIGSMLSFSGLTFYGGFIVAAVAVSIYSEKHNIPWLQMADIVAPALIIGYGIGRIGCQVAGDGDWGIVVTMPQPEWLSFLPEWLWAYNYPHNILNQGIPIQGCAGSHCFQLAKPVFPTPIYETTMAFLIFAFLWIIRKKLVVPGSLFAIYLMFNGAERFLIEKIRVNNVFDFLGLKVTQAEVISTILFLFGLGMLIILVVIHKRKSPVTQVE